MKAVAKRFPHSPSWRHRLVARYYRTNTARARVQHWLQRLLAIEYVRLEVMPGVVMELDPLDFLQREILVHGGYELATLARFDSLVASARGFTDFGAHIGLYTLRAARALVGRGGRVFAIEPTPAHAAALLHNAGLSGLTNIELCSVAASSTGGLLRMIAPHPANTGGSRLAKRPLAPDYRYIPLHVVVRPAAELVPLLPPECLDLIKIDIEGHEFNVLRSLLPAAPRLPSNILFEYRPAEFDYGSPAGHLQWLRSVGYELLTVEGIPFHPEAPLPDENLWARLRS